MFSSDLHNFLIASFNIVTMLIFDLSSSSGTNLHFDGPMMNFGSFAMFLLRNDNFFHGTVFLSVGLINPFTTFFSLLDFDIVADSSEELANFNISDGRLTCELPMVLCVSVNSSDTSYDWSNSSVSDNTNTIMFLIASTIMFIGMSNTMESSFYSFHSSTVAC